MKKVSLFLRVSTLVQTTDNQKKELIELCKRRDFQIVEIYQETISGTKKNEDRKEFSRLLNDMKKRKFEKLVVWSVDRLGRDMKELIKTLSLLDDYKISLYSYQQNLDTDDTMGRMFFYFVSIFSEFENNIRRERQKVGIERVRNLGLKYGGNNFVTEEKKQKLISLFENGQSYRKIKKQIGDISLGSISSIIKEKKIIKELMNDDLHEVVC